MFFFTFPNREVFLRGMFLGYVLSKSNLPACIFGTPLAVRGFSLLPYVLELNLSISPKKKMKEVIRRRCSQKTGVLSVLSSQTSPMTSQAGLCRPGGKYLFLTICIQLCVRYRNNGMVLMLFVTTLDFCLPFTGHL